jgi:transmembrane sensor
MSNLIQLPNHQRIREDACAWLVRLDAGLSERDREALNEWLAASRSHADILLEMSRLWDEMDILAELEGLLPLKIPGRERGFLHRVVSPTLIASLLLGCVVWFGWDVLDSEPGIRVQFTGQSASAPPATETYRTAVGEQSSVRLADGTRMILNTASQADISYSTEQRTVNLRSGEASFDVVRDPLRPFVVYAGDRAIEAVGTTFNVQLKADDDVEVTVTEGKVSVMPAMRFADVTSAPARPGLQGLGAIVSAGESVVVMHGVDAARSELHKLEPEDIEIELAWQHGMLIFKGEPLGAALLEVGRYTTVAFALTDPALADVRVGGYFQAGDIDGLLVALQENFSISAQREGGRILLSAD